MSKLARGLAAGMVVSLALVGCSSAGNNKDKDHNKLGVVATTTQICDYVKNIDADINLTCLLAPNASAHEHEMTREQMDALSKADLLLKNGIDLEHFLDNAVTSSGFAGTTVDTSEGVSIAKWPFPPEEGESQPEFTHDPHIWTSPVMRRPKWKTLEKHWKRPTPIMRLSTRNGWMGTSQSLLT